MGAMVATAEGSHETLAETVGFISLSLSEQVKIQLFRDQRGKHPGADNPLGIVQEVAAAVTAQP